MIDSSILSLLICIPMLGALLVYVINYIPQIKKPDCTAKALALGITLINFAISLVLWSKFDAASTQMQFVEKTTWITNDTGAVMQYYLGVDGLSILFILLTTFLMPVCIISSWHSVKFRVREYMMAFLIMESMIIGVFTALDLLLFYVFFEAVLIPMYLIIGIWGGKDRVYAAYKFFLYTLAGSVFLLIGVIYIYYNANTLDILELKHIMPGFELEVQKWLWLAFFASFAVKVPMWPVHTWLPDAHVQAPTAGSVILAGVLLKLGGYGFLRFSLPLLPAASYHYADLMFTLSVIAVVYTSLVALMQEDMKKLIAYSSIAHMGFVTAGLFAFNQIAIEGAIFQMISHGIVSGALFLAVGVLYDRMHTKEIAFYNGLSSKMPKFAFQFMVFMLASVGLPATAGFVGEFMILLGLFKANKAVCAFVATGMVLGAAYMLWLYARTMFGKIQNKELKGIHDLNLVEKLFFWPLAISVVLLGIWPNLILKDIHISVNDLEKHIAHHQKTQVEKAELINIQMNQE